MAVEFDPTNKYIKITSGTSITGLEIYNATMDWCDAQENMAYSVPMKAIGKAPLGGGVYTDSIFILQDGWKIKLYDGTYQFTVYGTVITDDESSRTVPPDTGYVEVVFQVSSQATIISGEGAGITQQDKEDIAGLVWTHTSGQTLTERVNLLRQIEQGKWKIVDCTMTIYDNDGTTELLKFELFGKDGTKDLTKGVYERRPI